MKGSEPLSTSKCCIWVWRNNNYCFALSQCSIVPFGTAGTIILILSSIWNSETVIPYNIIMAPLLTLAPLHSSNEPNWVLRDIPRLQ